jgi:hypothetical protein
LCGAAGQALAQPRLVGAERLGHDLRAERRRCVELRRELLGAGEADQLGAVDVDHVQRDRHTRRAARLRNQLVGDEVGRNLVEDVGHLERQRTRAAEAAGRLETPSASRARSAQRRGRACLERLP